MNPFPGLFFLSEVRKVVSRLSSMLSGKNGDRFPAMFELFRHTSATFGKAGIADRFAIHQYFSLCFVDHLLDDRVGSTGNSLVALTMVVGTDIENVMVFAVVPTDQLSVAFAEREESTVVVTQLFALFYLA